MPSGSQASIVRRTASPPALWPIARGTPRRFAQRPLPSMMIATWRALVASVPMLKMSVRPELVEGPLFLLTPRLKGRTALRQAQGERWRGTSSLRHDFLLFRCSRRVDLADETVGQLLHLVSEALVLVLGDVLLLLVFLERFHPVAADVADGDLGLLGILVRQLDQLLAPLLGQVGHRQAQRLPVDDRVQSEVGVGDALL